MTCTCIGACMAPNLSLLALLVVFGLLFPAASDAAADAGNAFNVTEILGHYPEFKLFNLLLSKTRVANEVNSRNSVTLLVTDNAAVDWLLRHSGGRRLPHAAVKELVSVHVVLDYLDAAKLAALPRGKPTQVTTLFQTTGTARDRAGFLNITATPAPRGGAVFFVSAAPGSLVTARLKRAVTAKPYNVSVLQISNLIVPRGFLTTGPRSPSPPAPMMRQMATAPSPAPPPPRLSANAPSVEDETTTEAPAPAPSHGHAVQATNWWSSAAAAAAVGMACVLRFL